MQSQSSINLDIRSQETLSHSFDFGYWECDNWFKDLQYGKSLVALFIKTLIILLLFTKSIQLGTIKVNKLNINNQRNEKSIFGTFHENYLVLFTWDTLFVSKLLVALSCETLPKYEDDILKVSKCIFPFGTCI